MRVIITLADIITAAYLINKSQEDMWYEEETTQHDAHSGADHFRAGSCTDDRTGGFNDGRHGRS